VSTLFSFFSAKSSNSISFFGLIFGDSNYTIFFMETDLENYSGKNLDLFLSNAEVLLD